MAAYGGLVPNSDFGSEFAVQHRQNLVIYIVHIIVQQPPQSLAF